ncbi:anaphase-promoting complex subunit 7-like [Lytechinus variegatus]|uniref:anaphase-promoting complex subunit 7-like n=1 Tax=Lytechinus variegatus TaxID=7654 RepID=UPI001BB131E0|nr:anaphase-promoting complex subunit 7-like [Lytechinus variegatus]
MGVWLMDHIRLLRKEGLFGNLSILANLVKTASEQNTELLTAAERYQLLVYYADALYEEQEYKRAEGMYRKALQLKKMINKSKVKGQTQSSQQSDDNLPSELDVRFRIYQCHNSLKNHREALAVLESIPAKMREPKVNMALAKLYQKIGMERSAIYGYKEVLRQCPLALQAVLGVLSLGVRGTEIAAFTVHSMPSGANMEWLSFWLKGHAYSAGKEYSKAISTFKALESGSVLRENTDVLCCLAENYFMSGDMATASTIYQRVHSLDPHHLRGMEIYSYILYKEKKVKQLQSLSSELMEVTDKRGEPWVAMGYYCLYPTARYARSVYFAEKAYPLKGGKVQALLLKGKGLLEMTKVPEATLHFREAVRCAPSRFEAHEGLVECYVKANRIRDAITTFTNSVKVLGNNPRTITFLASLLARDRPSMDKAKSLLDKTLFQDPNYLPAIYLMVDILNQEQKYADAISLIRKQLEQQSTSQLHQMLGDCLALNSEPQEALDQYSIALSMDPSNDKAMQGMHKVEKSSDSLEATAEDDMDAIEESGEDVGEYENSDPEGSWVDNEWLS